MRSIRNFFIFLTVIMGVIVLNITSFVGFVVALGVVVVGLVVAAYLYPVQAREVVVIMIGRTGESIGYRLSFLVMITLVFFIAAVKYGAGEPILLSKWKIEIAPQFYSDIQKEKFQKIKNIFWSGQNKIDQEIDLKKKKINLLKNQGNIPPALLVFRNQFSQESDDEYRERQKNWLIYGVFASDDETDNLISKVPAVATVTQNYSHQSERTWLWWKLFFSFLILTLFYAPFFFVDEAVDFLEDIVDHIRERRRDYKEAIESVVHEVEVLEKAKAKKEKESKLKLGWFGRLYTSDMAAEFTIRLIQGLINLLRR